MWKLILLSFLQSICLTSAQIFLKLAMQTLGKFSFTWRYFADFFANWQMALSGISIAAGSLLWLYILRHFPFSMAYPMVSLSYVFGMLAAVYLFHETVPLTRWIGLAFILFGVILITKQ